MSPALRVWEDCWYISATGVGSATPLRSCLVTGVDSVAEEPIPGIFRRFDLTLQSDSLYDLDSGIPDVIGLRCTARCRCGQSYVDTGQSMYSRCDF